MPKKYAKHGRNKRKPNMRQQKFVKELAKGKSLAQAAREAGYSDKNAKSVRLSGAGTIARTCAGAA
jgi:hypothetical protein